MTAVWFTAVAQPPPELIPKFDLPKSGLELERHTRLGSFFDVVGKQAAVFGYENRSLEAWVYPLEVLEGFSLSFHLQNYPLEIPGSSVAAVITVRPEATVLTYSHAAFTVRQIVFAPVSEPGIIMLLDVQSVLPMTITVSFKPRLKLMWPAGLMTGNLSWDAKHHTYSITEESKRFVGMIGSPIARDVSVMPYQEEPRDVPNSFVLDAPPETTRTGFIPIVITGSTEGRDAAKTNYDRLLASARSLFENNVQYYRRIQQEFVSIDTPDRRLNEAFEWAKTGVDKGLSTNPMLGSGLLAGFRTSGDSERPGFAWFFGRDALWTTLAINSYGDFASTRTALAFLKKYQREDGKIPHEISQSAALIPWFKDYPYPWASADATPLYIIAHADYWRASGDLAFIRQNWESILKAYRFTSATDTDNNGLIENTGVGHGWVEGGALYPPHEEIYLQGLWIEALRGLAEMAGAMNDYALSAVALVAAERTRAAVEKTYWLDGRGFYAFATSIPRDSPRTADDGPYKSRRQERMNALDKLRLIDEDTVLPAVPLWWRLLDDQRAQSEIDHLGAGDLATDWGARIISNQSPLYDPLSYHYGSVWPLFTGWSAMAAYRYGRPQAGYQALMANALLTFGQPLGYVTELLSGDFNADFGRSSHHQVWSEAMVITPVIRGMLGIEVNENEGRIDFAPQLPADWNHVAVNSVPLGDRLYNFAVDRSASRQTIRIQTAWPSASAAGSLTELRSIQLSLAPAFPLDASVRSVTLNGRPVPFKITRVGDVQRAEVLFGPGVKTTIVYDYDEGTDVYVETRAPEPGAVNQGLRILRSSADANSLRLTLEGLGGHEYRLGVRTSRRLGAAAGVKVVQAEARDPVLVITFEGPPGVYVRREVTIPLMARK
jgi:glycogen debranching enzyme